MMIKRKFATCTSIVLALPLVGCGVLASNGLDYSSYPIPVLPAAPVAASPAPAAPCQMPESGKPISLAGCKTGDTIVLRGVNFEFDKATLTLNAKVLLDQVTEALASRPDIKVEIDGHTDSKGTDFYNLKLSQSRANSVKGYLVGRGIAADRLSAKGFGEGLPIADNANDEGREQNRRVELKVLESAPLAEVVAPSPVSPAAKNSAIVILEPLAAHANEPGAGIPTSIGVLTHVPNPVEAGPTPGYKNQPPMVPAAPKPGPKWKDPASVSAYTPPPAMAPAAPPAESTAMTSHAVNTAYGNAVAISNFSFAPETLFVASGTTVTWTNKDQAIHTVKFLGQDHTIASGESFSKTFNKPGEYVYQCGIHAAMKGKVVVN